MPEAIPAVEKPPGTPPEAGVADQVPKPGEGEPGSAPATQDGDIRAAEPEGKGTRRFERRIARLQREAADARAETRLLREQMERLSTPVVQGEDQPKRESYPDEAGFIRALVRWEADKQREQDNARRSEEDASREAEREAVRAREGFEKQRKLSAKRHDDFDDVLDDLLSDSRIADHPGIGGAIAHSEVGAELAYYLGTHPEEAESIAEMSPYAAAVRLGEIQVRIRAELESPKGKPASQTPEPINPLAPGSAGHVPDTKRMTDAEWLRWREDELKKRRRS